MRITLFFHVLGMVLWAGGVLNLSRMMAFHVQEELEIQGRISLFEVRLFFFVTLPGLLLSLATGLFMLSEPNGLMQQRWMLAKLGLVLILAVLTMILGRRILLLRDTPAKGKKGPAMALHGVIGLCVAGVIYLVIVRPF